MSWQLNLNISKYKALLISNKRQNHIYHYSINSTELDWVDSFKYLGVTIDKHLKWSSQCHEATAKASRILNLLRRTLHGCSKRAKKIAYSTFISEATSGILCSSVVTSPAQEHETSRTSTKTSYTLDLLQMEPIYLLVEQIIRARTA